MTADLKWLIAHFSLVCIIVLALFLLYYANKASHEANAKLSEQIKTDQASIADSNQKISSLAALISQTNEQTISKIANIEKAASAAQTPAQIAAYVQESLDKALPAKTTLSVPATGPAVLQLPTQDLPALRDLVTESQVSEAKLTACQSNLQATTQQVTVLQSQTKFLNDEIEVYKKQAHPSLLHRLGHNLKYVAGGVGLGLLLAHGGL